MSLLLSLFALFVVASAKTYFKETFDDGWQDRWVLSTFKGDDAGKFEVTAGKFYGDETINQGLQTTEDAKFYQISAAIPEEFSNKGKDLVLQYTVKHEQKIDCGGGYIKLLPAGLDQTNFNGDSPYNVMFGPDICGSTTKKVHTIFNYKDNNHLIKGPVPAENDEFTHLYTLVVHPDNTYSVSVDGEEKKSGSLKEDWDMLPPKKIKDPNVSKPEDWVDQAEIEDPDDMKPEDWDQPAEIEDPDAEKPEDWDDDLDGEYEKPTIPNPDFKGEWRPRRIPNPEYKGPWEHPMIKNPEYFDDDELYSYDSHAYVGFEIWQVKSGTIFDNIIVTDSVEEAKAFADETFFATRDAEKQMKEEQDEAERIRREEEAEKARQEEEAEEEEDDEEEEEEEVEEETAEKEEL